MEPVSPPIPARLAANCRALPEREAWLALLPDRVRTLARRWSLRLGAPFEAEASCAWVAPAERAGEPLVLKIAMPHTEGRDEIAGLRHWGGDPTVRLVDASAAHGAMLLERCEPGTVLRALPETEQDEILAGLLQRLWSAPPAAHPFRSLAEMTASWRREAEALPSAWPDAGLARTALECFESLPRSATREVLLATDLHAGNVLRATRRPWLVIDPKPFVGDPAYDATQHLLNCEERLRADPRGLVARMAQLVGEDETRIRHWLFARIVLHPGRRDPTRWLDSARALAP